MNQQLPESATIGSGIFNTNAWDWYLITDTQDVQCTLENVGTHAIRYARTEGLTGLYVLIGNAEYTAVYGFSGCVPWTYKTAYRIYPTVFHVGDIVHVMGHGAQRYRVKHVNDLDVVIRPIGMRHDASSDIDVDASVCIRTQ